MPQVVLAGTVKPLKLMAVWPVVSAVGERLKQELDTGPPAADIPTSVSVKEAFERAIGFGLATNRITVEVPPGAITLGLNCLEIVGGEGWTTVRVAVLLPAPAANPVAEAPEVVLGLAP